MKRSIFIPFFLLTLVFLSGCIDIDVYQQLKRNENYDLSLSITFPQDLAGMVGDIKDSFIIEDSLKDKAKFSVMGNSLLVKFEDIDPKKETRLFKDIQQMEINDENKLNAELNFLNPKNIIYQKEFRFPNYYYSFNLKTSKEDSNKKENISFADYIIDNSSILDGDIKSRIKTVFTTIYSRADVEGIAWTRTDYNNSRWNKAKTEFLENFSFKNTGEKHILISINPVNEPVCKIESDLYFDFNFFENISKISAEFSKECRDSIDIALMNATAKLEKLFLENNLNSSGQNLFGDEIYSVNYTVGVFGRVQRTNGEKVDGNKINFEIFPGEERQYYIEFFESIFSVYKWAITAIIIILIGLYLLPIAVKHIPREKKKKNEFRYPLAFDQRIVEYIIKAREYGMDDEKIRKNLIMSGWKPKDVDNALKIRH